MTNGGSGDIKIKLYLAIGELVGIGSINDRLRRATWGIYNLLEDDLPSNPPNVIDRFMAVRAKLLDHGFPEG